MPKFITYLLSILVCLICQIGIGQAGKVVNVDNFGKQYGVDFDQIHRNLRRFEEHATSSLLEKGGHKSNNVVLGALTVFFGERKTASNEFEGHRTFYLETSPPQHRNLLVFESTLDGDQEPVEIEWGKSGLGLIDGHSGMVCQPRNMKAFSYKEMHRFFQKAYTTYDNPNSSPSLNSMQKSLKEMIEYTSLFNDLKSKLQEDLSIFKRCGNIYNQLCKDENKIEDDEALELEDQLTTDELNLEELTKSKTFADHLDTSNLIKDISSILNELKKTNTKNILQNVEEWEKLKVEVQKAATKVYFDCWHSEQRLCYFLFSSLEDLDEEDISDNTSEQSEFIDNVSQISQLEQNTLDWDILRSVGGALKPKLIFFHIHSRQNFCKMCQPTLIESIPTAISNLNLLEGCELGGILGSYREDFRNSPIPGENYADIEDCKQRSTAQSNTNIMYLKKI